MPAPQHAACRWPVTQPREVVEADVGVWTAAAGADVAVLAQYPARDRGDALPVVILCHGLGGSRDGYAGLGAHLAARGYAVLHPQFLDSFAIAGPALGLTGVNAQNWKYDAQARSAMHGMLFDPWHWVSRVVRVHAVIDSLGRQRHLPMTLRTDNVIIAGHSFGAYTAQLVLGTRLSGVGLEGYTFTHPAVVAGVLLSPQGSGDRGLTQRSWDGVTLPMLVVTASNDLGPHGEGLTWRRQPFDNARSGLKHLAVVRGGDHSLGGIALSGREETAAGADAAVRAALSGLTVAFADRVHGDRAAGDWLASAPFATIIEHEHQERT